MSEFEASAAALGYAFQLRFALLQALDAYAVGTDWSIGVETADDVEVIQGEATTQLQLKHTAGTLTDASVPLWKTLRIWTSQASTGGNDSVKLVLLTTGPVGLESAPYYLAPHVTGHRDVARAHRQLVKSMAESSSGANATAIAAFGALDEDQQLQLLHRVVVLAEQEGVLDIGEALRARVSIGLGPANAAAFIHRLEGWWFQRCLELLTVDHDQRAAITGEQFDAYVTDLRAGFVGEMLPIDPDIASHDEALDAYLERNFVLQLRLVTDMDSRILSAVRDYYRAFTQRSRWMREHLATGSEVENFERRLVEQWRLRFDQMIDDLGQNAAEDQMRQFARDLYAWVESAAHPTIRAGVDEPFLGRGSYHGLADEFRVGWHPEFEARLVKVLEPVTSEDL